MTSEPIARIEAAPDELSSSLCAMRLRVAGADERMKQSLARLGQLTPVQAWRASAEKADELQLFDGAKRVRAAQALSWPTVRVEVHALDAVGAKVRLLLCNAASGLSDLEVAWVVRSLYREDKLDQPRIAQLLGHDKSWVSRKLTLAEGLSDGLTADVRLGLLPATAAVELARLQRCNQDEVAKAIIRRGLTTRQTAKLVESLLQTPAAQWPGVLEQSLGQPLPPAHKSGGSRRTPSEQLLADAWAMKRLSTRLHVRLMERSLSSLGEPACALVSKELHELNSALTALGHTLDSRLSASGAR